MVWGILLQCLQQRKKSSHFSKEYLKDFRILLTDTFNVKTTSSAILQSLAFLKQCINCARYEQAVGFQLYFRLLKNKQGGRKARRSLK